MWSWKFIISLKVIITTLYSYSSTNIVEQSSVEQKRAQIISYAIIVPGAWFFLIFSLERKSFKSPCVCRRCVHQGWFHDGPRLKVPALPKSRDMNSLRNRRLSNEFNKLHSNNNSEWLVELYYPNDLGRWKIYINGRPGTPYENGMFRLLVTFPTDYPFEPPDFQFHTLIFQPRIDNHACMSKLCLRNYTVSVPICDLLHDIVSAIHSADDEVFPYGNAVSVYNYNLTLSERQAALRTFRYTTNGIANEPYLCSSSDLESPTDSPSVSRTQSPCSYRWTFQQVDHFTREPVGKLQNYTRNEEVIFEHNFRLGISQIEWGGNITSFSHATQICENGNMYRVRRDVIQKKVRRRYRYLAFYNSHFVEDTIIADCLAPSVNTNIINVIAGILKEGRSSTQELKVQKLVEELQAMNENDTVSIGLQCIKMYTCDSFLSKSLNRFLRERDRTKVDTLGPFCKLFYSQFNKYQSRVDSLIVYRGERFSRQDLRAYKRGTRKQSYRWLGFMSTSTSQEVARTFTQNAYFIIRLEKIYNDGRALNIQKHSSFPEEDEVLLRPGVEFSIEKFEYEEETKVHTFYLTAYI